MFCILIFIVPRRCVKQSAIYIATHSRKKTRKRRPFRGGFIFLSLIFDITFNSFLRNSSNRCSKITIRPQSSFFPIKIA